MPRVPTYDSSIRTSALPTGRLSVQASPGEMGANIGQGLANVARDVFQVAQEERRKKIETDVTSAVNELDGMSANSLRLARDPKSGIRGSSVDQDLKRFTEDFDKRQSEIAGRLTDPEARRIYSLRAQQRRFSYAESLMGHADGVVLGYQNDVDESTKRLADERISLNYDNPGEVTGAYNDKMGAVDRLAERNGWSQERKDAERLAAGSAAHIQVVRGYLAAGRTEAAQAYIQRVPGEQWAAKDRDMVTEVVTKAIDATEAQAVADEAHAQVLAGKLKPTEVEAWIKDQTGGDVAKRDAASSRFQVVQGKYEAAVKAEVGKASDDAMRILVESGGDYTKVASNPDIMGTLTRHDPNQINRIYDAAAAMSKPPPTETDAMTLLRLNDMSPQELAKLDAVGFYGEFKGKLSDQDFKRWAEAWGNVREASRNPAKQTWMDEFVSSRDQIGNAMVAGDVKPLGVKSSDVTEEQALAMADFEGEAARRLNAAQVTKGNKLTVEERQQVLDRLSLEAFRAKGRGETPPWQRRPGYDQIKKMKAQDGQLIVDRFRSRARALGNADPDDETIEQAYEAARIGAPATQIDAILSGK